MKITLGLGLVVLASLATACASDAKKEMKKDVAGNYATTSQYNAMERDEFTAAMEAGMRDFDARLDALKVQADKLGPDAIKEYHDHLDDLAKQRREFGAEVEKHRTMLADEWRRHREDVAEMYVDLRKSLDDAYEDVVDEA
jgi:hypothetical protein